MIPGLSSSFASRSELTDYLRTIFPESAQIDSQISPMLGGRREAERRLQSIDPVRYASSRNFLSGAVTRLSPYLRHGVLNLAEVRNHALAKVATPSAAGKLINELGWRDYWQRVYDRLGEGVHRDREVWKTGRANKEYATELPEDIREGKTGLACMDAFVRELRETGYLHNHARMWFASYLIHFRQIRWQLGANFFLEHLLDGDPASNHLSWQWVASTFSHKPYFFNRENLERYTDGQLCRSCPLAGHCPMEGDYESLERQLFRKWNGQANTDPELKKYPPSNQKAPESNGSPSNPILWFHLDHLNPKGELLTRYPKQPAIYIFDDRWIENERPSLKRIQFIYECLLELPVTIRRGDTVEELKRFQAENRADGVATVASVRPDWKKQYEQLCQQTTTELIPVQPFIDAKQISFDLARFSRYWGKAESLAYQQSN